MGTVHEARPTIVWAHPPRDDLTVSEPKEPRERLVRVRWSDGHEDVVVAVATAWAWTGAEVPFVYCWFTDPRTDAPVRGWLQASAVRFP